MQSLAIKYRPNNWDSLVEQDSIRIILERQLRTGTFKQSYLFVGPAGTGKTTSARIFANKINNGQGNPIEIDAASHGNVDDIRDLVTQARLKPLDAEYKIFIIDECHCLSSAGWSAMLKLIEEPPATAIFIFATTDVQKVPKTIISRCQRFDFQRISYEGIVNRIRFILIQEHLNMDMSAIEFIAKLADGGMRDALTLLDKCISYNSDLTLENTIAALGTVNYDIMFDLTKWIQYKERTKIIEVIEQIHNSGKDLKLFLRQYIQFILDTYKYIIGVDTKYIQIPLFDDYIDLLDHFDAYTIMDLIEVLVNLQSDIKYSASPKYDIEAALILMTFKEANYNEID